MPTHDLNRLHRQLGTVADLLLNMAKLAAAGHAGRSKGVDQCYLELFLEFLKRIRDAVDAGERNQLTGEIALAAEKLTGRLRCADWRRWDPQRKESSDFHYKRRNETFASCASEYSARFQDLADRLYISNWIATAPSATGDAAEAKASRKWATAKQTNDALERLCTTDRARSLISLATSQRKPEDGESIQAAIDFCRPDNIAKELSGITEGLYGLSVDRRTLTRRTKGKRRRWACPCWGNLQRELRDAAIRNARNA